MLNVCSFLILLFIHGTLAQSTAYILGHNTTSIDFEKGWKHAKSASGVSYLVTAVLGKAFQIDLPENTTSFGYTGFARAKGASYGVCLDCDEENPADFKTFQANDKLHRNGDAPIELFSMEVDPTALHTLSVYNFPDARFNQTGSLSFVSLRVTVQDVADSDDLDEQPGTTNVPKPTQAVSSGGDDDETQKTGSPAETETDTESSVKPTSTAKPTASDEDDSDTPTAKPTASGTKTKSSAPLSKPTSSSDGDEPSSTTVKLASTSTSDADSDEDISTVFTSQAKATSTGTTTSSAPAQSTDASGSRTSSPGHDANKEGDIPVVSSTKKTSVGVIIATVVLAVALIFPVLVGLLCFLRRRRRLNTPGGPRDIESGGSDMASIGTVNVFPPPQRPLNPYADGANVPLEFPMNSTMAPQRVIAFNSSSNNPNATSPSSSFGDIALSPPHYMPSPMRTSWIHNPRSPAAR